MIDQRKVTVPPIGIPVTVVLGLVGAVIVPVPDTTDHCWLVAQVKLLPDIEAVVVHAARVWSLPALANVSGREKVIDICPMPPAGPRKFLTVPAPPPPGAAPANPPD